MARGNRIVVSADIRGVQLEGTIGDTSKPGTIMQVQAGTSMVNGRFTWVSASLGTDGAPGLMAVLMEDVLQGKTVNDAYVAGTRCVLYVPLPGEDVNVLVGEGTTQSFNIGDRLMIDSDVGNLIAVAGSPQSVPFIVMETLVAVAVPNLTWCKYTGH